MEMKLIVKLNFEYRVEKMKTSIKLGNLKIRVYFGLEDPLMWQAFGSLKATEFLSALGASVAELPGSRSCGSNGRGTAFLNRQKGLCLTQFSDSGYIPIIFLN